MRLFSVAVKKAFRAPKRTKTRVECNNIVTTEYAANRGQLAAAGVICLTDS